jgi:hypothetical protein
MAKEVAVWMGLVAGGVYIMEFLAVPIFKPLGSHLQGRLCHLWSASRVGGPVTAAGTVALVFVASRVRKSAWPLAGLADLEQVQQGCSRETMPISDTS